MNIFNKIQNKSILILIILTTLAAVCVNLFLHEYDNKYKYSEEQPFCGVMEINSDVANDKVQFLIEGWEFYQYKLLSPKDFETEGILPDAYVDIGKYQGFDIGDPSKNHHGSATYRMRIFTDTDDEKAQYMLELPEIFSSYKIWINGKLMYQCGNPDPQNYVPKITNTNILFEAENVIEIIIAVTDYTHYYSGIYYPPALGTPQAVNKILMKRYIVKGMQCFFSLAIGLCYFCIAIYNKKDKQSFYYLFICLFYIGYCIYPFVHTVHMTGNFIWYRLEDFCFYGMLLNITKLQWEMVGHKQKLLIRKIIELIGLFIMIISIAVPEFFIVGNTQNLIIYRDIINVYKYGLSIYLVGSSVLNAYRNTPLSKVILSGIIIMAVSIMADSAGYLYEPVILGWGVEIAGFVLICMFGITMVTKIIKTEQQNERLIVEHDNMREYVSEVAHDLKAPIAAISGYVELIREGVAQELGKEDEFLVNIDERSNELKNRINKLKMNKFANDETLNKTSVKSVEYLNKIVKKYNVEAIKQKINLYAEGQNIVLNIDEEKMNIVLENLIINALRYTGEGGNIKIGAKQSGQYNKIYVKDTGIGMSDDNIRKIFQRHYTTENKHLGLGLNIAMQTAKLHGGHITVKSEVGKGTEFDVVIPK